MKISLCVKKHMLGLGASLFKYVATEGMELKYHIKICGKNDQVEE